MNTRQFGWLVILVSYLGFVYGMVTHDDHLILTLGDLTGMSLMMMILDRLS